MRFGVDIGGTTIKIGMFKDEELLYKCEIKTDITEGGKNILGDVCKRIEELLLEKGYKKEDCLGIGIGVPGPVTAQGEVLGCVNLGWGRLNIEEEIKKIFGDVLVKAGNDANVAALGEQKYGCGKGYQDMIMVTLGTGVGGGIISEGRLIFGNNGAAGEIGHIPVNCEETKQCSCGKYGCLEQYASATGVVRLAKEYMSLQGEIENNITAKDVFDRAKSGDKPCMQAVASLGKYMGMALGAIAATTNPKCIAIGGGVSKAGDYLTDTIRAEFLKYTFKPCSDVDIKTAMLGNDAGIYGAVALLK